MLVTSLETPICPQCYGPLLTWEQAGHPERPYFRAWPDTRYAESVSVTVERNGRQVREERYRLYADYECRECNCGFPRGAIRFGADRKTQAGGE